jgi:hypothetical protein
MDVVGLDIPAALQIADILGVEQTPALLSKIKAIEMEALSRLREEAKDNAK